MFRTLFLTASSLIAASGALGTGTTDSAVWTGAGGNGLWSNGANWQSQVSPGAGTSLTVADFGLLSQSSVVTVDTSSSLLSLYVHPDGAFTYTFTGSNNSALSLYGGGLVTYANTTGTPLVTFGPALSINLAADQTWYVNTPTVVASTLKGSGALRFAGYAPLTLSGANTYTGGTSLISGTVDLTSSSTASGGVITSGPLGTGTIRVIDYSTTPVLQASASSVTLHNPIQLETSAVFKTPPYFNYDPISLYGSGVTTLRLATTDSAFAFNVASPISGRGQIKVDEGNITLSGSNNFAGLVSVGPHANLTIASNSSIGAANGLVIEPGGNVRFNGTALTLLGFADGSLVSQSTTANNSSLFDLAANSTLTVNLSGSFNGTITGAGAKIVSNGFLLSLGGSNTYSGGTTLAGGTLSIGSSSVVSNGLITSGPIGTGTLTIAPPSASSAVLFSSSDYLSDYMMTPKIVATVSGLTLANPIVLNNPLLRLGGDSSYNSSSTYSNSFTLSGPISGTGALEIGSGGTITLSGANTFSGGILVNSGTLAITSATGAGTGPLTIDGCATVSLLNAAPVIAGLYGSVYECTPSLILQDNSTTRIQYGEFSGVISGTGAKIIKEGTGSLALSGNNTYSGGTEVAAGTLIINGFSSSGAYAVAADGTTIAKDYTARGRSPYPISSGPVGTGTLRVGASGTIATYHEAWLGNSVELASGATIGSAELSLSKLGFTFLSSVSILDIQSTVNLVGKSSTAIKHQGILDAPNAGTAVTFKGNGSLSIDGSTSSNISSIVADGTSVIFNSSSSLPATNVAALNNGYIGIGSVFDGQTGNLSFANLLSKITQPAAFAGLIGLEGYLYSQVPTEFTGPINLSGFTNSGFRGLSSSTSANIASSASITLPAGGSYRFGGGGGRLGVNTNLTDSSAGLILDSSSLAPLTLVLRGSNTYGGTTSVTNSFLSLDSSGALPGTGRTLLLGANGYAGYTPYWNSSSTSAADFISRLSLSYDSTGIIGFDSAQPASSSVSVGAPIDLSGLPRSVFLGTTTYAATLTGAIKPPPGGMLQLAAFQGGRLIVASDLTSANGVLSVLIGHPSATLGSSTGTVELAGQNTFANGTALNNGTLALGSSATFSNGVMVSGPLGLGQLNVNGSAALQRSSASDVAIANNIVLNGSSVVLDLQGSSDLFLKLGGTISGPGKLVVDTKVLLSGANTFTGGTEVFNSLTVDNNLGLGSGPVHLSGNYAALTFGSNATSPLVYNLSGDYGSMLVIPENTTLRINNSSATEFSGYIATTSGSINKLGTGSLTLSSNNFYSGGTTITQGTIIAMSSGALGSGPITLAGGNLRLEDYASLSNPITVGSGSRLQGNGTISGNATLGSGAIVAPGNSIGKLTFSSNLTWSGGGKYDFELQTPSGIAGFGYDTINVSSTLSLTATASNPFIVNLISLNSSGSVGAMTFDPTLPYSWTLVSALNITGFDPSALSLNTSSFSTLTPFSGTFSFSVNDGSTLMLNFTPVPEPQTWLLMLLGGAVLLRPALRRKRR